MIEFKRFKGFKHKSRKIGANADTAGAPPTDGGAISKGIDEQLDEQSVPKDLRLRDIHKHLTKRGWSEDRHSGGHKIYTHPIRGSVSVPAHPTAPISPGVVRQIFKLSETIGEALNEGETHEYVDHVHDDHKAAYEAHPDRYEHNELYTDTTMRYSRHHRRPSPVHTHHFTITPK
jgi:predicted RNA binding protein YcfA (HicA-like mRNA interferase family)